MKNSGYVIALWLLAAAPWTASAQPIPVSLPTDANGNQGDTVSVAIVVADLTDRGVLSFLSTVNVDPQVLKPLGASTLGTISEVFGSPQVETEVGRILVGAAGNSPLAGQGRLVNLLFEVVGEPDGVTALTFEFFIFNTGIPQASLTNGRFTVTQPPRPIFTVSPEELEFGTVLTNAVAELELTLKNDGDTTLVLTEITIAGPDRNDFLAAGLATPFELAPGSSQILQVQFSPAEPGARRAVLQLVSNDPDRPLVEVALRGEAQTPPEPNISVSPASLDFGAVVVDSLVSLQFLILNQGEADLLVSDLRLIGPAAGEFTVNLSSDTLLVPPQDSQAVLVSFKPSREGSREADIEIASNDPDQPVVQFSLRGTGTQPARPAISVTPRALAFAVTAVDSVREKTLTLTNIGDAILQIRRIAIVGAAISQFRIQDGPAIPTQIQPGEKLILRIAFQPTRPGRVAAIVLITSNDPFLPILRVPMFAEAVGPLTVNSIFASPPNRSFHCSDTISVSVRIEVKQAVAPVETACTINGILASKEGDLFTVMLALESGVNTILARCNATDRLGRTVSSQDSIQIRVADSPISDLQIVSPEAGSRVTGDSVLVQTLARIQGGTPPFQREVLINNVTAHPVGELFEATIACSPGELLIEASLTAIDSCGRQTTASDSIEIECAAAQPSEVLLGLAEDRRSLLAIDLQSKSPEALIIGKVVQDGQTVAEMEGMAFDAANRRLFVHANSRHGRLLTITLEDIPPLPGTGVVPAKLVGTTRSTHIDGLAFNPDSGLLYGVDTKKDKLVRIDVEDGTVTAMGKLGFEDVEGLAFSKEQPPVLHGIDNETRRLITIDTETGRGRAVGDSTLRFANVECLAFRQNGSLFGFSDGRVTGQLLEFDLMTGLAEEVVVAGGQDFDIEGLAFVPLQQDPVSDVNALTNPEPGRPSEFVLGQNYPNPFNPETTIAFGLPTEEHVKLHIFNIRGQRVAVLLNEHLPAGRHVVRWDGRTYSGQQAPSGIYIIQVRAGEFSAAIRMTLLR